MTSARGVAPHRWTVISMSEQARRQKGLETERARRWIGWKVIPRRWVGTPTNLALGQRKQKSDYGAEAKHIDFQLKIQENIIHIYTKYGDSLNAERSMLKTISEAKDNKNNKRAWLHKSYV
jgi:hypothetical protein